MSRHVGPQSLAMFDALVLAAALYCASLPAVAQYRLPAAIFDSDPNHIWNRTHSCLFVRQSADGTDYGADALRDAARVSQRLRNSLGSEPHPVDEPFGSGAPTGKWRSVQRRGYLGNECDDCAQTASVRIQPAP